MAMNAENKSPLLRTIVKSAKSMTDEVAHPWDDIPAAIAEGALYDLVAVVMEEDPEMPVKRIARRLGFVDEEGNLV